MFTCATCGKEQPEAEERSIGSFATFGLRLISRTPQISARRFCRRCVSGAAFAGVISASVVLGLTVFFTVGLCIGIMKAVKTEGDAVLCILGSVVGLGVVYLTFFAENSSWRIRCLI